MNQNEMVQSLRAEIMKLQRVLDLLAAPSGDAKKVRSPEGPKATGGRGSSLDQNSSGPKKRVMSAEGKARIAAGQKKRWAQQKGVAPGAGTTRAEAAPAKASKKVTRKSASKGTAAAKTGQSKSAGKKAGSPRTASAKTTPAAAKKGVAKKSAARKSAAKNISRPATKRAAKQATPTAPQS